MTIQFDKQHDTGTSNKLVGWVSMVLGAIVGLVMGIWAFSPLPAPGWIGDYGELSNRFIRLGHSALFGLGIVNVLIANELKNLSLDARWKRITSLLMNFANICLPPLLFAASAYHPMKYLFPIPAFAMFLALCLVVYGLRPSQNDYR